MQSAYNIDDPFRIDNVGWVTYGFNVQHSWNPEVETVDEETDAHWETKQIVQGDFEISSARSN